MTLGKRACYHILESEGPNNDFKFDDQLLEYCTWTDCKNNFFYLCRWVHSRHTSAIERKYSFLYQIHTVENPRTYWSNATTLYGYTRPERYYPPSRTNTPPGPTLRTTLEDVINDHKTEYAQVDESLGGLPVWYEEDPDPQYQFLD